MNIERLLELSLKMKREGSPHRLHAKGLLAHLEAVKSQGFKDFDFYPDGVEKPEQDFLRFPQETRAVLEGIGYEIFEIRIDPDSFYPRHLRDILEERDSKIKAEDPPLPREAAILRESPILPESCGLSRLEQEHLLDDYKNKLRQVVWGVKAIIPDAFTAKVLGEEFTSRRLKDSVKKEYHLCLVDMHTDEPFYVATTTKVDESSFLAVGRRIWVQMVDEWYVDDGMLKGVHVMPVVVPSSAPLFEVAA